LHKIIQSTDPNTDRWGNTTTVLKSGLNSWTIFVMVIALLIAAPILFVLSSIFSNAADVWGHLAATVLPEYILNSLWLMLGVGSGVLIIGVGTAWLVTMCRFPGDRLFEWLLLLPMAAPAYILAYTYTELLEYYGPVQTGLRNFFGWSSAADYWFPSIRSVGGAIAMLILVLYPYVYLLARVAFLEQSVCTIEASRSLGCNPWRSFFVVALPLARPSITAGLALVLMETLSDFGTVDYFGIGTFTTGIYRTWLNMGERQAASQLSAVLMIFILWLVLLERWSRRQAKYYQVTSQYQQLPRYQLNRWRSPLAILACFVPVLLGFLLPSGLLLHMSATHLSETLDRDFWQLSNHSLILAIVTAILGIAIAAIMAYGLRLRPNLLMRSCVQIAAMGYAIPGTVIAVGTLIPVGNFDNLLDRWFNTGLLFSGTIIILIFAYLVRFLAISFNTVDSSLNKIKPSFDDAASSFGYSPLATLIKVHIPIMAPGLLTAAMLVFVDVMKELPATLVIRPFNFDTLAIRVYQYASDERLVEASAPALAIILVGIVPVLLLSQRITRSRRVATME
jgi:iron(III) transport system permease protein